MADFNINVFLDDEKLKKIEGAGLAEHIIDVEGKKAIQIAMTKKDKKKLVKGFGELEFCDDTSCLLPEDADNTLIDIIVEMKSVDVMKFAITKLYNPLAGRDVFGRGTGGH